MTKKSVRYVKPLLLDILLFLLLLCMVLFSKQASLGAALGLKRCAETLVPSLFPFMALCIFSIQSGFANRIGRLLGPVTRLLFYLPPCAGTTILVGLAGGYPVGARSIEALLEENQITKEQAHRMLFFCVGAGPAFVISAVGVVMLGSLTAGVLLFCAQAGCALLIGILLGLYARRKKYPLHHVLQQEKIRRLPVAEALVRSTEQAATSTIVMCAFVILFSTLLGIMEQLGIPSFLERTFYAAGLSPLAANAGFQLLFEVTAGVSASAAAGPWSLFLISLSLGWAGLSVHFQIYSSLPNLKISYGRFMLARLCHGLLAAGVTLLLFHCMPNVAIDAVAPIMPPLESRFYSGVPFGIALLFMCGLFLLCLPKKGLETSAKT